MTSQILEIKPGFFELGEVKEAADVAALATNLFVITHLGQLKQMQSLIKQQQLQHNMLVVLYTYKNIQVPSDVQDGIDISLFTQVIFAKIPHGLQKYNIRKNIRLNQIYKQILALANFKTLYINSFEGHYNIILSLARSSGLRLVLIEEGTATYKLKKNTSSLSQPVVSKTDPMELLKRSFVDTIGRDQVFKKLLKGKNIYKQSRSIKLAWAQADISYRDAKSLKQFGAQLSDFVKKIWLSPEVQGQAVGLYQKKSPVVMDTPFTDFDLVYASYPTLLAGDFGKAQILSFFAYSKFDEDDLKLAQNVADQYQICEHDVLFVSQRYSLDLRLLMKEIDRIIRKLAISRRVFIKLHPKESDFVLQMYQAMSRVYGSRIVVLEGCGKMPAEALLAVSGMRTVVGLTSSTLIYAPLIDKEIQSISIAKILIQELAWSEECRAGIAILQQHLAILEQFDKVIFVEKDIIGEELC